MHTPFLVGFFILLASTSFADHCKWKEWKGDGSKGCKDVDIQVVTNGDAISVLFSGFNINMPTGQVGDGLNQAVKSCHFQVQVSPPEGTYLAGFRQVYTGGIIKSKQSMARLNIRYQIGSLGRDPKEIKWEQGREILPEDAMSTFIEEYDDVAERPLCKETLKYQLSLRMTGKRPTIQDFVLGGLDSLDTQLKTRVSVVPVYKPCVPTNNSGNGPGHGHGSGHGPGNGPGQPPIDPPPLVNTNEHQWVNSVYLKLLDRPGDAGGLAFWVDQLKKTNSQNPVVIGISASEEAFNNNGRNPVLWVTYLYRKLLNREPDPTGLNGWVATLLQGKSRNDVVRGFVNSAEYRGI